MPTSTIAEWLLRLSIAGTFLYPPVSALTSPFTWIGYFPAFLLDAAAGNELILLHAFGVVEVLIALWVLSRWNVHIGAIIAGLMLLGITVFNLSGIDVLFRDVTLALAAFALAALTWPASANGSGEASSAARTDTEQHDDA